MADGILAALTLGLGWPSYQQYPVERWQGGQCSHEQDYIAEETPVSVIYNGVPHVVMLASPTDLAEFALGFSLTEGIIDAPQQLLAVKVVNRSNGIEVHCKIPEQHFSCLADKGRNLTGRTGCGLCGASTLQQALRELAPVAEVASFAAAELLSALAELKQHQPLNRLTGAIHAVAWVEPGKGIVAVREDVGRHNALDKLIGFLMRNQTDLASGFVVTTSRASSEMVQKTAAAGIGLLAAISAPTGLAIRIAENVRLTLIGFARDDRYVVYTHPQRLTHPDYMTLI